MKELIRNYQTSCELVKSRIDQLTAELNILIKNGGEQEISDRNLRQRIALLYTEHREMRDIIGHLDSYARAVENRAQT